MSVASLTVCRWSGQSREDEVLQNPDWIDVETAIRALNNTDRNDIYLHPSPQRRDTWLAVGGGNGFYVVTGACEGERHPFLPNEDHSDADFLEVCVGGQVGTYASRQVVSLELALAAVRQFFEAGGFDCGVNWDYA